ncbi:MAG: PEP-CTERM sorting domain-containing protein [Verrucomicrobiales bacterium]
MKPQLSLAGLCAASLLAVPAADASTLITSPTGGHIPAASVPGIVDFDYDAYAVLGGFDNVSYTSHTDAYSWDHPNLADVNPAIGNQTGWTHLSRWVAFSLENDAQVTIRIDAADGVTFPDQNNPGSFVDAGDDLIPAFTLWSGFESRKEDSSLGLANPNGGHRFDNDGDETTWMDDLVYVAHDGNASNSMFVEATLDLPAGSYTMNIAGSRDGAFVPGTVPGDLRKGFTLTLTTVPEPSRALLLAAAFAGCAMIRRRR